MKRLARGATRCKARLRKSPLRDIMARRTYSDTFFNGVITTSFAPRFARPACVLQRAVKAFQKRSWARKFVKIDPLLRTLVDEEREVERHILNEVRACESLSDDPTLTIYLTLSIPYHLVFRFASIIPGEQEAEVRVRCT